MKRGQSWVALALALGLGALALHGAAQGDFTLQRERATAEPWRLLSAALWHWNALHLLGNMLGLGVLALLGWRAGLGDRDTLAWLLAWPLTQALLCLHPQLPPYAGLSGVLHAGVAVAGCALCARTGRERLVGAALMLGLLVKLGLEAPWGPLLRPQDWWGGATLPLAHAAGAAAGALCRLAVAARPRLTPA